MRCPTCWGTGYVNGAVRYGLGRTQFPPPLYVPSPCPDCLGGEVHCCSGETACNDPPVPRGTTPEN